MESKFYSTLPEEAAAVRTEVFVEEQGFINEMDDIDSYAEHIVAFDGDKPVGTCRFFKDDKTENDYIAGRIAVRKEYRGRDIGTELLKAVERAVKEKGGTRVVLHAQVRAKEFYEKHNANPLRGFYPLSLEATDAYEAARKTVQAVSPATRRR